MSRTETASQQDQTRYNKTEWKLLYQGWVRQLNRRKRVPKTCKRVRDTPVPPAGILTKHQANRCNIYTEDLVQIHEVPMLATAISMNSCEPCCLVDSVGLAPQVSSITSDSYNLFFLFFLGCSDLKEEGPNGDLQSILPPHNIGLWVTVPFLFVARGNLFDDNWIRHRSMSIAEYYGQPFT